MDQVADSDVQDRNPGRVGWSDCGDEGVNLKSLLQTVDHARTTEEH
jgi:hypothetical protein